MNISNEIIEKISNGNYSFDFLSIKLTQMKEALPRVYSGSGSITYEENGNLALKMYHLYTQENEDIEDLNHFLDKHHVPGKIISKENYFEMNAVDVKGNVWTADYLSLSGNIELPSNGRVITSKITSISTKCEVNLSSNFNQTIFTRSNISFPCNARDESVSFSSYKKCDISRDGFNFTLNKVDEDLLQIKSILESNHANETSADLLIEAISISLGKYIQPIIKITNHNGHQITTVYSHLKKIDYKSIIQPFSTSLPTDADDLANFVSFYIKSFSSAKSPFFGYWYRILDASNSGIENKALIVTTSIEGVLKGYFDEHGKPDSEILKDAKVAKPLIKSLAIGPRIKSRVLTSLGNLKGFSAKNALMNLKANGKVSEQMIGAWSDLRNKCAHADQLKREEIQKFIDQTFCCIGLFYILLFIKIKYSGGLIDYSQYAWPYTFLPAEEQ